MTMLVTGAGGTVGAYFAELKAQFEEPLDLLKRSELDIGELDRVRARFQTTRYTTIVNLAGATDVDRCETDREWAHRNNTVGAWNVALAAEEIGAEVVQISTTQLFGGDGNEGPFSELDRPHPINFYAKTKLGAEEMVRTVSSRAYI